ncbi:hypothetical protein Tco_0290074 [Tanacetum coccineum]
MISSGSSTSLKSTSFEQSSSSEDIGPSKALLQWYDDGTNEDIVKSPKKPTPTVIVKSPVPIKGCVLGLANDPALMRSGQLDYKIEFPYPIKEARSNILQDVFTIAVYIEGGHPRTEVSEIPRTSGTTTTVLKTLCSIAVMKKFSEKKDKEATLNFYCIQKREAQQNGFVKMVTLKEILPPAKSVDATFSIDPLNTAYLASDTESESEISYLISVPNFFYLSSEQILLIFLPSWITSIMVNGKNAYELKGKFLDDLHNNAFSGTNEEDVVEHIEYFLKIVDPIDLPNVNQDKLRVFIFPIPLVGDAWRWFDGIKGSITKWPTYNWREDGYCNGGNLPGAYIVGNTLRYQDLEWYDALKDSKLKKEALKNKAIMEGIIDDNDESSDDGWKRWDGYEITNHDQEERTNVNEHEEEERCEVFNDHERPVCNIRRFEMIKYSFGQDEEYVAMKEDEYKDLTSTSEDACQAYQEIFRMMDDGWMDLAAKKSTKLVKYQSSGILCVIVDIAFKYRTFFLDDNEELEHIKRLGFCPEATSHFQIVKDMLISISNDVKLKSSD